MTSWTAISLEPAWLNTFDRERHASIKAAANDVGGFCMHSFCAIEGACSYFATTAFKKYEQATGEITARSAHNETVVAHGKKTVEIRTLSTFLLFIFLF